MNKLWIDVLKQLADDSNDFDHQGGHVVFVRRGREFDLTLRDKPGAGLCVVRDLNGVLDFVPLSTYIQRDLLELPRLAQQIQKSLERLSSRRPARYIDGPAMIDNGNTNNNINVSGSSEHLKNLLCDNEPGVTNLIQLMAPAGHGKTVLLEEVSKCSSHDYTPVDHPYPIVLLVDLLGRFVGNIDDAIAGAINNTYSFPSLTQKEVIIAMTHRWLALALDGFDELVARIGPKDAFLRISDLLDQLDGSGSLIISARESFFELYRISSAIRSYLQPKRGSFKTSVVRLQRWTKIQGEEVFKSLGSPNPAKELLELRTAFADDLIAFQPFFLTRLADLWRKGERFGESSPTSGLTRVRYVVDRLLDREVVEKWRDSKGNPIISKECHEAVFSTIAEEMFRTGAFFLRVDELKIAGEIALHEKHIATATINDAVERLPTHAFLQTTERGYRFAHDKFLHYFLGIRLSGLCVNSTREFVDTIAGKELTPEVMAWIVECFPKPQGERKKIARQVIDAAFNVSETEARSSIGLLVSHVLSGIPCNHEISFDKIAFSGDGISELVLDGLVFSRCAFTTLDLESTKLNRCKFSACDIDSVIINDETSLSECHFNYCRIGCLQLPNKDRTFYSPVEISERLTLAGATIASEELIQSHVLADEIPEDVVRTVEKLVKASHKGWDICVEEFCERYGPPADAVIQQGLRHGILRTWAREVGGPKRHFVRFQADRNRILGSLRDATVDPTVERFWRSLI